MADEAQGLFEFGPFRLDPVQRLLTKDGSLVHLEPKVFDTLSALVEARGRLLSKDDLLARVWAGTFVEEGSLARNISTLRRALGDDLDAEGSYIQTIPKRGYRFRPTARIVVRETPTSGVAMSGDIPIRDEAPSWAAPVARRRPAWIWLAAGLFVLAVTAGLFVASGATPRTAIVPTIRSIAVLPIQNLSGDPGQEFVADGTTEELIATLSRVRSLHVIARTSVTRYKATTKSAAEIARELGVDALLEGAVRQSDGRVRITTQLVDTVTNTTLWSKSYETDATDLFAVQDDVARAVVGAIRAEITTAESARLTRPRSINPTAQAEILKGHALRWRGSDPDYREAIAHYARAVELEPDAAVAYAGMALAWQLLSGSSGIEPGRAAAAQAISLDSGLAEAHAAMANAYYRDYEFEAGHVESARALALSPGILDGCFCYAIVLAATGRDREALDVADQGVARNPVASGAHFARGLALYFARKFELAIPSLTRAIELEPHSNVSRISLSRVYGSLGREADAIAVLDTPTLRHNTSMAIAFGRAGRRAEALELLRTLASANPPQQSIFMAQAYAALGENEAALAWLTRSVDARETQAFWVIDEAFDRLRPDPRFAALVKRLKMPSSYYAFLAARGLGAAKD